MAKYVYPALFLPEEGNLYSVRFPDLECCYTSGAGLSEAMEMANDVLCMTLYGLERDGEAIQQPSTVAQMEAQAEPGEFVTLIACDTMVYRRMHDSKAVKKTLSIPSWLNEMAEQAGVNFSGVLQEALKKQLRI